MLDATPHHTSTIACLTYPAVVDTEAQLRKQLAALGALEAAGVQVRSVGAEAAAEEYELPDEKLLATPRTAPWCQVRSEGVTKRKGNTTH